MRPLPYGSGKEAFPDNTAKCWMASMRPLPYGSGKAHRRILHRPRFRASMRPLPYGSGKGTVSCLPPTESIRFNEAAPLRKRKAQPGPVAHRARHGASMRPLPYGSGKGYTIKVAKEYYALQ